MLKRSCIMAAILCGGLLGPAAAQAQKKDVRVTQTWSGSVADEKLQKNAPRAITSSEQLGKIWKAWKIDGDVPKIDFTKFLVIAVYSPGSKLTMAGAKLDERGNLEVLGLGTRDFREGFRFVLGVVSNDGVKTVGGKELPAPK